MMSSQTRKWLVFAALVAATTVGFFTIREHLSIDELIRREDALRADLSANPARVYLAAFILYVVITALSLPVATGLTLLYAWLFGFWPALVLVSFASTAGATLAFLLSRYLLRDWVQRRFGARLAGFNEALARDGAFFLFTLRLLVIVPFWLVNLLMGLTPIRTWTFWWVSQLGMLPATCIYVWTGANLPSLEHVAQHGVAGVLNWKLIAGLAALGAFPWIVRATVRRIEPQQRSVQERK
jgi:uncharacterized membrane protein YdjX (TVP38/TMEM64 family)